MDIPMEGQNIGSMSMFGEELQFGDPIAEFVGQALCVVAHICFFFFNILRICFFFLIFYLWAFCYLN
uniref:ZmAO-1 n=1 Tax=Arundo donax TaxID=35708 RepID=A0A0A9ENL8_ARUDO